MRECSIDQAVQAHAEGAVFVDVREPQEFAQGHVPGALNLPMSRLTSLLDQLDRDRRTYVVCASGNRSGAMTEVLRASGFDAVDVTGGTIAWMRAGHPLEK